MGSTEREFAEGITISAVCNRYLTTCPGRYVRHVPYSTCQQYSGEGMEEVTNRICWHAGGHR